MVVASDGWAFIGNVSNVNSPISTFPLVVTPNTTLNQQYLTFPNTSSSNVYYSITAGSALVYYNVGVSPAIQEIEGWSYKQPLQFLTVSGTTVLSVAQVIAGTLAISSTVVGTTIIQMPTAAALLATGLWTGETRSLKLTIVNSTVGTTNVLNITGNPDGSSYVVGVGQINGLVVGTGGQASGTFLVNYISATSPNFQLVRQ
jgi:hypothetical protein